ncbi:helix-turn-helix domain-containing protein [Sutcliffiella horikoshii]|uniref:helix-turn-helix domain-containing protein n=1 Tax=Sutcliffiella horikoshii TaxID=79883 RepID=UPI001CFE6E1D|nr:helix-turn-helix transcriptional regulator [Sutcliffiella horikoshii]
MNRLEVLGVRLKKLRHEKGITQDKIATKMNTPRSSYSKLETGKQEPSVEQLVQLSQIFSVDINYLIGRKEEVEQKRYIDVMDDELECFFRELRVASQESRKKLMNIWNIIKE